jgi:hypothetical protein
MKRLLFYPGLILVVLALAVGQGTAALPRAEQLPNLVPLPPRDIVIAAPDEAGNGPPVGALRFAVAVANRGKHAFDLFGLAEDPQPASSSARAMQCISWLSERACAERREVGRFVWHPAHAHHHFEDFALYELRTFRKNGRPNFRPAGLVGGGEKVSFCLMDIEPDDGTSTGPTTFYGFGYPLYMSCAAGSGFQGISAGWRDVYSNRTPGQQIDLQGIADGTYALVVVTDPEGQLLETSKDDNIAVAGVTLSEGGTKVSVTCESEPGDTRCLPIEAEPHH